jgi:hypothetical protein
MQIATHTFGSEGAAHLSDDETPSAALRQRVRSAAGASGDDAAAADGASWGGGHHPRDASGAAAVGWLAAMSGAASGPPQRAGPEACERGVLRWIWDAGLPSSIWVSVFVSYALTSVDAAVRDTLALALSDADEVIKYRWAVLIVQVAFAVALTTLMVYYTKKWHYEDDRDSGELDETGSVDLDRPLRPPAAAAQPPRAPADGADETAPRDSVEALLLSSPLDRGAAPEPRSAARDFLRKYGILIVSATWLWVASSAYAVSSETINQWTSSEEVGPWRVAALWFRALVFLASAATIVFTTVNLSVVFALWSVIIGACVTMAVFYVLS